MKNKPELLALIQLIRTRTKQIEFLERVWWSPKMTARIPKYKDEIEKAKILFTYLKMNNA